MFSTFNLTFSCRNESKRKRVLPYCKDSLALAHKNINQRRIRLHRFRFLHNDKCELTLFNGTNGKRRSLSQPNINRNWVCLSCEWLNCTVAWHCLSCDYPSILAPIYKATINKKQLEEKCDVIIEKSEENENIRKKKSEKCGETEIPVKESQKLGHHNTNEVNVKRCLSMESGLNHKCVNKKRCQLCLFNRYDLFSENQGINNNISNYNKSNRVCHHTRSIQFPECIKLPFIIDDLSKSDYNSKNLNNYSSKRINKSLSSISVEPLSTSYSSSYLKESSATDLRRSLRLTKINNTSFETSSHYKRQLSEPNTQTEINNRIYQNVTCDICGICNSAGNKQTKHSSRTSGNIQETNRFTITTLKRQKGIQLGEQLSKLGSTQDRAGVFVAVKDWTIAPPIIPNMNDNSRVYENSQIIKQHHHNTITNNNGQNAYENVSLVGAKSDTNDNALPELNGSKTSDTPLYAVVNKANRSKVAAGIKATGGEKDLIQPLYSYIGITDPNDQNTPSSCDNNTVEDDGIYATISANSANNNINGSSIASFSVLDSSSDKVKSSQITSTSCTLNSNDANGVSETGDIYAKVWKGPKKSMDTQKR